MSAKVVRSYVAVQDKNEILKCQSTRLMEKEAEIESKPICFGGSVDKPKHHISSMKRFYASFNQLAHAAFGVAGLLVVGKLVPEYDFNHLIEALVYLNLGYLLIEHGTNDYLRHASSSDESRALGVGGVLLVRLVVSIVLMFLMMSFKIIGVNNLEFGLLLFVSIFNFQSYSHIWDNQKNYFYYSIAVRVIHLSSLLGYSWEWSTHYLLLHYGIGTTISFIASALFLHLHKHVNFLNFERFSVGSYLNFLGARLATNVVLTGSGVFVAQLATSTDLTRFVLMDKARVACQGLAATYFNSLTRKSLKGTLSRKVALLITLCSIAAFSVGVIFIYYYFEWDQFPSALYLFFVGPMILSLYNVFMTQSEMMHYEGGAKFYLRFTLFSVLVYLASLWIFGFLGIYAVMLGIFLSEAAYATAISWNLYHNNERFRSGIS